MELSPGQSLALEQLNEIATSSKGALEVLGEPETDQDGGFVRVHLSLATKQYRKEGGFEFRDRERLRIRLYPDFPFTVPLLYFSHKRFIGKPHVQWGHYICLYQSSEAEWHPGDGLYGFFQRIDEWMTAAGKGELDPEDAPLHPPVTYSTSTTRFVFACDTPPLEEDETVWIGRADLEQKRKGRFDVIRWVKLDDWASVEQTDNVAATILLSRPLPMEYPETVNGLFSALEDAGVTFELLYSLLRAFAAQVARDNPAYIVIGAPMRRKEAGAPLRQHLTTWEIDSSAVNALHDIILAKENKDEAVAELAKWMVTAKTLWCRSFENRPEVTNRRDQDSILAGIQGKRILLLGCGALGSAIAEHLVRAGAAALTVVDNGVVSPGLLVRQKYSDRDVGFGKAECLARSLKEMGLSGTVEAQASDLRKGLIETLDLSKIDLIINATASAPVGHAIERDLRRSCLLVPLISLSVSAAAQCGSVVAKMPRFVSGTVTINRLSRIALAKDNSKHPVFQAFWPDAPQSKLFQPEPGCSTPTFVGSSADLAAHAATLLNVGLKRVSELEADQASTDLLPAPWSEMAAKGPLTCELEERGRELELRHGFEVLLSNVARRGISSEIKRIGRTRSEQIETGGLIFGEIDEAHGRIYVDSVTGPPPDSEASEEKFLCGISGTRNISKAKLKQSAGSSRFIGIWHTHPVSKGRPSDDDLFAMARLLHGQEHPPRHVLMLIVGFAATEPQQAFYLYHRRDIRVITGDELRTMLERNVAA